MADWIKFDFETGEIEHDLGHSKGIMVDNNLADRKTDILKAADLEIADISQEIGLFNAFVNNEITKDFLMSEIKRIEKEEMAERQRKELEWHRTLTQEQIDNIFNAGYYNETIKGYVIKAAMLSELSGEQIQSLLNGIEYALSEMTKKDADKLYRDYQQKS